jgi:hypothetical protein
MIKEIPLKELQMTNALGLIGDSPSSAALLERLQGNSFPFDFHLKTKYYSVLLTVTNQVQDCSLVIYFQNTIPTDTLTLPCVLVSEAFDEKMLNWCIEHSVDYIAPEEEDDMADILNQLQNTIECHPWNLNSENVQDATELRMDESVQRLDEAFEWISTLKNSHIAHVERANVIHKLSNYLLAFEDLENDMSLSENDSSHTALQNP